MKERRDLAHNDIKRYVKNSLYQRIEIGRRCKYFFFVSSRFLFVLIFLAKLFVSQS